MSVLIRWLISIVCAAVLVACRDDKPATATMPVARTESAAPKRTEPTTQASMPVAPALSEREKIESLIATLSRLDGATFVRNGKAYTVAEAVTHMRRKWRWKSDEIVTVEDFIRIAATRSSTSGGDYVIRLADGTEVRSEDWFRARLAEMEGDG